MSELDTSKGEGEEMVEDLQAELDAELESLFQQEETALELAGPPNYWDLYAVGPYQVPSRQPSRVIEVGERASILVVVRLNRRFPSPFPGQNACDILTGFNAKIELNFVTSNMQTMRPVPELNYTHCIQTTPGRCWYRYLWTFRPRDPACLYETNICARICNCDGFPVRQYSGFVRWVENLDYDMFFGAERYTFDHPIRYAAFDFGTRNCCPD